MDNDHASKSANWFEKYGTAVSVLVGLIILAAAVYFGHGLQPTTQQASTGTNGQPASPAVDIKNVKTQGDPIVGNANAPVEMALFFDYQCPYCKQFDQTVLSQIYTNYVQTGKVKVVFKDFDFIGPDSLVASEYEHAIWDLYPDKFYAWYTAMFAAQDEENKGFGDEASIQKLTATVSGIDAAKVAAQVKAKKAEYDAATQATFTEAQGYGIQGTPSVIVGTTLLQGMKDYATVTALLDAQLKK